MIRSIRTWASRLYRRAFPHSAKDAGVPGIVGNAPGATELTHKERDIMRLKIIVGNAPGATELTHKERDIMRLKINARSIAKGALSRYDNDQISEAAYAGLMQAAVHSLEIARAMEAGEI